MLILLILVTQNRVNISNNLTDYLLFTFITFHQEQQWSNEFFIIDNKF